MASSQDEDMYLFQSGLDQTPSAFAGQDFDSFLDDTTESGTGQLTAADFLNPSDLSVKLEGADNGLLLGGAMTRSSRSSASSDSSGRSAGYAQRNASKATTVSPAATNRQQTWARGINGMTMPGSEQYYNDTAMAGLDGDLDASNQQMASAFDFETAASTPSGYDATSVMTMKPASTQAFRRTANIANFGQNRTSSPRLPAGSQAQFFLGSREASPLNAMLPQTQAAPPWTKHSPSSGLEETFNHITMNADSPGNATFSPNMQFNANNFTFDPESSATPSTYNKDISSPPSTIPLGDGSPHLTIYPTSLKSRVETQIPIKMILHPLPANVKKLRLPTHTVSKPKFLAKPEVDRSPEVLELYTSLVCTSAMQDQARLERALARARGEDLSAYSRPSPASSTGSHTSSKEDDEKPLNGGEVRICAGCIQRERKRASRKKQKKPEEEELFQKDEEKRVVVFNTSEIKDWVEVNKDNQPISDHVPSPPPGAMQVELPMRIACYCRHQNEKMGFQVIFTIKDYRDKVIAQAMTNSIMITDDHKTHNAPGPMQNPQTHQIPSAPQLPGAGVFSSSGLEMQNGHQNSAKMFKQSFSTTDLHGLQHNFNPHYPMTPATNPFAITGPMSAGGSGTITPRILSRPASPSGPSGPHTKRRKQSGSGKVPSGLTMTRLDTIGAQLSGAATVPNTAASSPYATNMHSFMSPTDRYNMSNAQSHAYNTSPPTPNGNETFAAAVNRSFSLENLPRQVLISAPNSRHPSRPSSPRPQSNRNSFGAHDATFGQAVNSSLMNQTSRRPPPVIHKLVPAEGSITGGTEVTLLGNGFYQGLEVMFGDTEATTTTFWGEKCLNCIAPPALQPGVVAVLFKHEHPQYAAISPQSQTRHSVFTYTDDREVEMLRLALRTIGKQMQHPTDDPFTAAQQLLQNQQQTHMWPQHGGYGMGGGNQRHMTTSLNSQHAEMLRLESSMLDLLHYATRTSSSRPLNMNLRQPNGLTLLHLSSSLGMNRMVAALLSLGVDPNSLDHCGHSPMHHAAMHGHEQVIYRLSAVGGNHQIRSLRDFTPADLATTLSAYQATLRSRQHTRSRSSGDDSKTDYVHGAKSASLQLFWDQSSDVHGDSDSEVIDDFDEQPSDRVSATLERCLPFAKPEPILMVSRTASRRSSVQMSRAMPGLSRSPSDLVTDEQSAGGLTQVWRHLLSLTHLQQEQLSEQLRQLQRSIPHLSGISQDHPVVRRMSTLLQTRAAFFNQNDADEKRTTGCDLSCASAPPPSYSELYPSLAKDESAYSLKKVSAMQAASDAAADIFLEKQSQAANDVECKVVTNLSMTRLAVQKMEPGWARETIFVWIPIALILLGFWVHTSGVLGSLHSPDVVKGSIAFSGEAAVEVL